jgi:hypothetical protein
MTNNKTFIADVGAFVAMAKERMLAVAKESLQEVIRDAQTPVAQGGNMPVDWGTLRNSLVVELRGAEVGKGADSYILGLSTFQLGDPFQVAWTASYAIPRHYTVGVGQGGGMWRDLAAQKWQGIVQSNARKVARSR